MIQPEPEGSTQGYLLVSVEVLRYDKRSKNKNIGIVSAEMELILEQTQQGISHEVSEEQPKPLYVPIKTEEEEPLPLDIVYLHSDVASSTRGTNTRGKAHYGLISLGPLHEEIVHVKKPFNMVKVTNVVLGLRAQKQELDV
nr:hypothetical protein [Tanacetum cinerariifolium]